MKHTEAQVREAMSIMRIADPKVAKAWEAQLRHDNAGAWFIIHNYKLRMAQS